MANTSDCFHSMKDLLIIFKEYLCSLDYKQTNQRTDREQYTRSNAATARLLTLVKPAEI